MRHKCEGGGAGGRSDCLSSCPSPPQSYIKERICATTSVTRQQLKCIHKGHFLMTKTKLKSENSSGVSPQNKQNSHLHTVSRKIFQTYSDYSIICRFGFLTFLKSLSLFCNETLCLSATAHILHATAQKKNTLFNVQNELFGRH